MKEEMNVKFTREGLAAAKPFKSERRYVRDPLLRGGLLQITPNGVKSFQLQKRFDGIPKRVTLGRFDSASPNTLKLPDRVTPATAVDYAAELPRLNISMYRALAKQVEVALTGRGAHSPAHVKRERRGEPALGTILDQYRDTHLAGRSPKTLEWVKTSRPYLKDFEGKRVSQIDDSEVSRWHAVLGKDESVYVANRAMELARAGVGWAHKRKLIDRKLANPFAGITKHRETKRDKFVRPGEAPDFFAALAALPDPWQDILRLAVYVGQRKGAVMSMRWDHIDLVDGTWRLPVAHGLKNTEPTVIALTAPALAILKRRRESWGGSQWVFPSHRSKSGHVTSPKARWADLRTKMRERLAERLLVELKIKVPKDVNVLELARERKVDVPDIDLRIHDLRRTLGSWAAANNTSLSTIGAMLGHRSLASTEIYARQQVDPTRQAATAAVDALIAAAGPKVAKFKPRKSA